MTQHEASSPTPTGKTLSLAVLPLRDVVVFPHLVIPLFVGRKKSIKALEVAMQAGKQIMLAAQKSASDDDPTTEQIHTVGTVASILQLLRLPDGTVKVLVEGEQRANLLRYVETGEYFSADVEIIESTAVDEREGGADALGVDRVRSIRKTEHEDPARNSDLARGHRRPADWPTPLPRT